MSFKFGARDAQKILLGKYNFGAYRFNIPYFKLNPNIILLSFSKATVQKKTK
jgi:hypothetical protein